MNLRPFRTIRGRLTLWAACVFVGLVGLQSALLLGGLESALHRVADRELRDELETLLAEVADESLHSLATTPPPGADWTDLVFELSEELDARNLRRLEGEALVYEVRRERGELVVRSGLPAEGLERTDAPRREAGVAFRTEADPRLTGARLRIAEVVLGPYRLQVARDLGPLFRIYTDLRSQLLGVLVVFSLIAAVGSYWIATHGLSHVRTLVRGAERLRTLAEGELPRSGARDEIDSLAAVLNDLLGRVRDEVRRVHAFTADAAHEIRTPLTAIRGHLEILLSKVDPVHQEALAGVLEEVERLSRLVNQLLLLEKLGESREAPIARERLDLAELARDLVSHLQVVAHERDVELEGSFSPAFVLGDAERLRQLCLNLLDNAFKHTPRGGRVRVRVWQADGLARAVVKDSGPGIAPRDLERVFDRFSTDRTRADAGTGLGLPIARAIARAHGGELRAAAGAGAELTLSLPCAPDRSGETTG